MVKFKINKKQLNKQLKKSQNEKNAKKIRANWMDRWARLSGCEPDDYGKYDYSKIDWNNPYVRIEYILCDPKIESKLGNDKTRAECIATEIPQDLLEIFYSIGPGNDKPYSEVYLNKSTILPVLKKEKAKAKKLKEDEDDGTQ